MSDDKARTGSLDAHPTALSVRSADALAGTRYRVLSVLGQGSMGQVFEAEHVALKKRVVAKVLRADVADGAASYADRLRLEAQLLGSLANEHIPVAHDLGVTPAGRTYLVMEYFAGCTLAKALKDASIFSIGEAIDLMKELVEGLAVAHAAGVVHRDVKPDNIFLAQVNGQRVLKILDFGVAKLLEEAAVKEHASPLAQATAAGVCIGTPRYLAPEQAIGSPTVDQRADLYAAVLILYRMVAGRDAFGHLKGAYALLRAQISETPRLPSEVALQDIPPALDALIMKGLEKLPEARFQSAAELLAALDLVIREPSASPWPTTERMEPATVKAKIDLGRGGTELMTSFARAVPPQEADVATRDTVPADQVELETARIVQPRPTAPMLLEPPRPVALPLPSGAGNQDARRRWIVAFALLFFAIGITTAAVVLR